MESLLDEIKTLLGQASVSFNNKMVRMSYDRKGNAASVNLGDVLASIMSALVSFIGTIMQTLEMVKKALNIA